MARTSTCGRHAEFGTESSVAVIASDPVTQRRVAGLLGEHGWSALPCDRPEPTARVILACVDLGLRAGAEYVRAIRDGAPQSALVVLSPPARGNDVRRALRAGADGIVFDAQLDATLGPAVQAVCAGMAVVPRESRNHVERPVLSHREKQILHLVVTGLTNRQIGQSLYLAESTVKTHLTAAFGKLGVRSRSEAAAALLDPAEPLLAGLLAVEEPVVELTV